MSAPWTTKHRPKRIVDVAGNRAAIPLVLRWLGSWKRGPPQKRALLLHGPPGTGKTVSVEAIANEQGLDLIEINASDKRNRDTLEKIVGIATRQTDLFGRERLILVDEVDGINLAEDRGAIDTLVRLIQNTLVPMILTANDPWDPKIAPLRNATTMIEYKKLTFRDAVLNLKRILQKEGVDVDDNALKLIVERDQGDMRSILNDLQTLTSKERKLTYDGASWLSFRDRKSSIFSALAAVFSSPTCLQARRAAEMSDVDADMFFEWIYENAPNQLSDPRDLSPAMSALARADYYRARMERHQVWDQLPYVIELETAGVAMAKEYTASGWVPMRFPGRIQFLSRTKRTRAVETEIGKEIGRHCHISSKGAIPHYFPYLKYILLKNPKAGEEIAEWLGLGKDAVKYLSEVQVSDSAD